MTDLKEHINARAATGNLLLQLASALEELGPAL